MVPEHECPLVDDRARYSPCLATASLTSNRSAKSLATSSRTVTVDRFETVVEDRSEPRNPVADVTFRITERSASTYTVPVPGTRKNRAWKYWRSSADRAFRRSPSRVSTQVDRNRVSKENRPVGSVQGHLDVAAAVAHHEGVPLEDLDRGLQALIARSVRSRPDPRIGSATARSKSAAGPGTPSGRPS